MEPVTLGDGGASLPNLIHTYERSEGHSDKNLAPEEKMAARPSGDILHTACLGCRGASYLLDTGPRTLKDHPPDDVSFSLGARGSTRDQWWSLRCPLGIRESENRR